MPTNPRAIPVLLSLLAALAAASTVTAARATDVHANVSISGEVSPGVYGRIDIGTRPPPQLVYTKPILIVQQPAVVHTGPLYMHVPPGHAKNWGKHCHKYNACAQPVYFVKSAEYDAPRKGKDHHSDKRQDHRKNGKHDKKDR